MKPTKDYKNYDYISVSVKEKQAEELEKTYAAFLWERVSREEHKRYSDIENFVFRRPHKIKNKDELQFLQVAAEEELNARDKLERNKHARSTAFGLVFGMLGVLFIVIGALLILLAAELGKVAPTVGGIIAAIAGVAVCACTAVVSIKLFKRENSEYEIKNENSLKVSREILEKAERLNLSAEVVACEIK